MIQMLYPDDFEQLGYSRDGLDGLSVGNANATQMFIPPGPIAQP